MIKILKRHIPKIVGLSLTTLTMAICSSSQSLAQSTQLQSTLSKLTINNAGAIREAINTDIPPQAQGMFGGLTKVSCQVGQAPSTCIPMGFFDTAFGVGSLTPQSAAAAVGKIISPNDTFATRFPWLAKINVASALQANPDLQKLLPDEAFDESGALNSSVAMMPFGSTVDFNATTVGQVPSMATTPFNKFEGFQRLKPTEVPHIGDISFSKMVTIPAGVAIVKMNLALKKERNIQHMVMSGSEEEPNAKCDRNCDYIEILPVVGMPYIKGGKLISGDSLQVRGGKGALKFVNGGKEPTGVHFSGMKFVVRNVNAKKGTATVNLNFRFCRYFFGEHCTPYFIGFPLWEINEKRPTIPIITTDASVIRVIRLNQK
jgi:hypothetical protein